MEILQFSSIPDHLVEEIQVIHKAVFEGQLLKLEKLEGKNNFLGLLSVIDNQVAGFKFGYEVETGIFYSWLGGVDPQFRRNGIAKQLMTRQHEELTKLGYRAVRTYSRNERKEMLIVNLKSGFDIVDTFTDHKGRHKIVLEKCLTVTQKR